MIYLDNNATTPVDPQVLSAMMPFWQDQFANPSSPYQSAHAPALAVDDARRSIRRDLHAESFRLIFTSGGSESNALALRGVLSHGRQRRRGVIVSTTEHASVRQLAQELSQEGWPVHWLRVLPSGVPDLDHLAELLDEEIALVSVMAANNETGVLGPLDAVANLVHEAGALLHSDAAQIPGRIPFDAGGSGADLISICGHKLHGPKGIGGLLLRQPVKVKPLIFGGDQEEGLRAGTENVAGIAGFAMAMTLAVTDGLAALPQVRWLRDRLEETVVERLAGVHIAGKDAPRLPNTTMLVIDGVQSESLLARLDQEGIQASAGSACNAGAVEPSPVLLAMGYDVSARASLRISLSRTSTETEVEMATSALIDAIRFLRGNRQ